MDRDDQRRYLIVGSVILEVVTPLFRQRLENEYKSRGFGSLQAFLNNQPVIHTLFHLRNRNIWCCQDKQNCMNHRTLPLLHYQWDLLYAENPGPGRHYCHCVYSAKPVQLDDLDITLAGLIMTNCCNLGPDENVIRTLRQYRNDYLAHNTKGGIAIAEYNSLWTDLTANVLQLDPTKQDDLIRIEKRTFDETLWSRYVLQLLDMHQKLDKMDDKLKEVYVLTLRTLETVQGIGTSVQGIGTSVHGISSALQNVNEAVQKILSYAERENSKLQDSNIPRMSKSYRLGQDIFKLNHQIDLKSVLNVEMTITGGVMMDDGRLVLCLCDLSESRLLIYNTDGSKKDRILLMARAFAVTAVNNSTVAVTLVDSKCIVMYDINNKHKLRLIPVPGQCTAISTINKLVVGCCDWRLLMIDHQTGEVVHTIQTDCLTGRVHAAGDRIFYCDINIFNNNNTILHCYSCTDDKVTTTTLPSKPVSITSLQDGSLYVLCRDGSVQHVSSDGQQYKQVTTKGLKLEEGYSVISYNPNQQRLFIQDGNTVKIFHHR